MITYSNGQVCYDADFGPYGKESVITNSCSNAYKFTGKERDTETGNDDFGARFYENNLGRFMTPDWAEAPTAVPYANFGNPQSLNLYSYVKNNLTTLGDPDGHGTENAHCVADACNPDTFVADNNGLSLEMAGIWPASTQRAENSAKSQNQQMRENIAATAESYIGSKDWAYVVQKGALACNTYKCNASVGDVTKEAGAPGLVKGSDGKLRYPLAAEWADKEYHYCALASPRAE